MDPLAMRATTVGLGKRPIPRQVSANPDVLSWQFLPASQPLHCHPLSHGKGPSSPLTTRLAIMLSLGPPVDELCLSVDGEGGGGRGWNNKGF